MTSIALPSIFKVARCAFTQAVNQRVNASPFGGSEQAVDLLNDRWLCSLEVWQMSPAEAAQLEAFIGQMRGQTNTTPLYHMARPTPRGTARGTQTLSAGVAQGASSLPITGISPSTGTYLAGDMIGAGGQLFMVAQDTTAVAGAATVPITNRVRTALTNGASVTWNAPTVPMRMLANGGVNYARAVVPGTTFDFGEAI